MRIKAVSFDAAGTLLENRYHPGRFASACAAEVGVFTSEADEVAYQSLLGQRLGEFWRANQTRNRQDVDAFWIDLTGEWLAQIGADRQLATEITAIAQVQMTQTDRWFQVYDDVVPALNHLDTLGIPALVLSNWDRSLHDILAGKGLTDRFKRVVASLEEGVEKPDPEIFRRLIEPLGLEPGEVLHIGDDVHDDVEGGLRAGFHVGWLNRVSPRRSRESLESGQLSLSAPKLTYFIEVIASI